MLYLLKYANYFFKFLPSRKNSEKGTDVLSLHVGFFPQCIKVFMQILCDHSVRKIKATLKNELNY